MIGNVFKEYCNKLKNSAYNNMVTSSKQIANKLDKEYYEGQSVNKMNIVGSVGRGTSTNHVSDLDLLYELPWDVHERFDQYKGNGQSELLQEIKEKLKDRFPSTDIRGDGQVVVIEFDLYTVELVPGFLKSNKYEYPDSNGGGTWKTTDPFPEIREAKNANVFSHGIYFDFCHLIRAWKNHIGFTFKGLLIDTLINNYFESNNYFSQSNYDDYLSILYNLFVYLSKQIRSAKYYALGSNQEITGDSFEFINNAKKALEKYDKCKSEIEFLSFLFGYKFSNKVLDEKLYEVSNTEEFVSERFKLDIKYYLKIDCDVSKKGFITRKLSELLKKRNYMLNHNHTLTFKIVDTNCHENYEIYWKVRNVGSEAVKRKEIRGTIFKGGTSIEETSKFFGPHYVECYLIQKGVCIARARIDVPIGNE